MIRQSGGLGQVQPARPAQFSIIIYPAGRPRQARRHKLQIPRFPACGKARSFRCSSSPHATRLRWARAGTPELPGTDRLLIQQAGNAGLVGASSISLASPQAGKLTHFAAPPLPTRPACAGLARGPRSCPARIVYLSSRQATPGSSLPSMNSREAPPPVEMWVILSA